MLVESDALILHNGARLLPNDGGSPVSIVTGARQWSFAVQRGFRQADFPPAPDGHDVKPDVVVSVTLKVDAGSIGIGLLSPGLKEYTAPEQIVTARPAAQEVRLSCASAEEVHLMIRNVSENDEASTFALLDVSLARAKPREAVAKALARQEIINLSGLVSRHQRQIEADLRAEDGLPDPVQIFVRTVAVSDLADAFGYSERIESPTSLAERPLTAWKMEINDAPILAYLYRNHRPRRHLEFGTWEGFGAKLCAESCDAEVWTINLAGGEVSPAGKPLYASPITFETIPDGARIVSSEPGAAPIYQTDAAGFIGWRYRKAGLSDRVHQILADSLTWDSSSFADGYFDSALIDGGHTPRVVAADTNNAMRLVRPGGLLIWHDFCPVDEVMDLSAATRGVVAAVTENWDRWSAQLDEIFWIRPSYVLVGRRR
jgi:hypothetical protein